MLIFRTSRLLFVFLALTILFFSSCTGFEAHSVEKAKNGTAFERFDIHPPLKSFRVGEQATYKIKWIGIPVATIVSTIRGIEKVSGRDAYFVELTARTNNWCSIFYKLEDRLRTWIDVEKLIPLKNENLRQEGSYRKFAVTVFDHKKRKAYFENFKDGSKKTFDIPENTQDTVSAFYHTRTIDFKLGEQVEFYVDHAEKIYHIKGKIEKKVYVTLPLFGRVPAVLTHPLAFIQGKPDKAGTSEAYFGVDALRAPLSISIKATIITSLAATLDKVEFLDEAALRNWESTVVPDKELSKALGLSK